MSNEISGSEYYEKIFHQIEHSPSLKTTLKLLERTPELLELIKSLEQTYDLTDLGAVIKALPDINRVSHLMPDIIAKLKPVLENIDVIHEVINGHKTRAKFKGQMLSLIEKLNCEIQKLHKEMALQRVMLKKTLTKRQNSSPRLRKHYRNPATTKRFSTTLSQQKHSIVSQRKLVIENNVKYRPIVPQISIDGVVVQRG